jgi:hypothetical protein
MQTSTIGFNPDEIEGRGLFDANFSYYSADYFYETAGMIEEVGMSRYFIFHACDYIFLTSYFILMFMMLNPLLPEKLKKIGLIIPILPAGFDLIENLSIDTLLIMYPQQYGYAGAVGVFTVIKWSTGLIWFFITLIALAGYIIRKRKLKRNGQN